MTDDKKALTVSVPAAYAAVWTPQAEVICGPCHGQRQFGGRTIDTSSHEPAALRHFDLEDEAGLVSVAVVAIATCDKCGVAVQSTDDFAHLASLRSSDSPNAYPRRLSLSGAQMEQTGGMCAALSYGTDKGFCFVTVEQGFLATFWATREGFEDQADVMCDSYETDNLNPYSAELLLQHIRTVLG